MRHIVFDTETTGFNAEGDDRLVEIGALEIINALPTGKTFHVYINPEREVPEGAVSVHGLTFERLKDEPVFAQVADEFLEFIGDDQLIAHNATFDMRFINAELKRLAKEPLPMTRAIDTLKIAREKFPGSPASLDALCRRFQVDNSDRTLHGALLDSELLAEVYLHLIGGRQHSLSLIQANNNEVTNNRTEQTAPIRDIRPHAPSVQELAAHRIFIEGIKTPVWEKVV